MRLQFGTLVIVALSAGSNAHHSLPALFDTSTTVTVTGEIIEFEFVAPHGYIHMSVVDESGELIAWQIETKQPEMLACPRQPDLRAIGSRGMIRGFAGVIPYRAGGAPLQPSRRSNPCRPKSRVLSSG